MNLVLKEIRNIREKRSKALPPEVTVLRRMRILRGIHREQAAEVIRRSTKRIEQFENDRRSLSIEQKKLLVRRYRYTWEEYLRLLKTPDELPDLPSRSTFKSKALPRTAGRKYQKQISKESRVLKIIREIHGWTQPQAAAKCGWSRSCIDHIENGRVEITEEKISLILSSYGHKRHLFDELMEAPFLRDEVVRECVEILKKLENNNLRAVKALLDNFR